jgi:internalin A
MQGLEQKIFISYAWGGEREELVNQLDRALQERGLKITRDKRDLGYKGSIREFMEALGQAACVIVVVSDKYLRSANCMFELVEIADNKQFYDRVFPILLSDADIYNPIKRIEYVKYWETQRAELADAIKTLDPANLQGLRDDMDLYDRIRDKISGLTSILKDMNTLTPEMHRESNFGVLYDALEKRLTSTTASTPNPGDTSASTANETVAPAKTDVSANHGGVAIGNLQAGGNIGNISIGTQSTTEEE